MEENNRKGTGVFYAVVGVATLVVAIIGATFAYFSASATNNKGVTGTDSKSCIDANGNTVCQVYQVTVTNGSKDIGINVKGTMNLTSTGKNMKWQVLTDATTVNTSATTVPQGENGTIVANQALTASGTHDFYLVIWLDETNAKQDADDAGKTFSGTVTFNGVNSDGSASTGITAKFNG